MYYIDIIKDGKIEIDETFSLLDRFIKQVPIMMSESTLILLQSELRDFKNSFQLKILYGNPCYYLCDHLILINNSLDYGIIEFTGYKNEKQYFERKPWKEVKN